MIFRNTHPGLNLRTLPLLASALLLAACDQNTTGEAEEQQVLETITAQAQTQTYGVENPSSFQRSPVLGWQLTDLGVTANEPENLAAEQGGQPLLVQLLDTDRDGTPDRLITQPPLGANQHDSLTLSVDPKKAAAAAALPAGAQAEVSIKEGGTWNERHYDGGNFVNVQSVTLPEQYTDHSEWIRYEGPGIESDKVAYRIYLDWRNGFDIFGKKKPGLYLQDIGLDGYDSYHEMADWGADILKVGDSLGMGGFGFWDGHKAIRVEQTTGRRASIIANGPLLSEMEIDYENWQVPGHTTNLKATFTMTASSPLVHVSLATTTSLPNMVAGLGKHEAANLLTGEKDGWSYIATFGPQTLFDDNLGKFILYRQTNETAVVEDEHNHAVVFGSTEDGADYYFGAVWAGEANGIQDQTAFEAYLQQELERLSSPIVPTMTP
ncbi:DUF4861 family protein [Kordiimonas sp.]|uniref:DUF4861 family protein n=1 Tax=Kordiimonas sp. TaxID=1970157 RepID=UPI003A9344DC